MNKRKLNSSKVLEMLVDNILLTLDELFENEMPSEFNVGGRYAYIECLEILSNWSQFNKFDLKDIEKRYPLK